MVQKNLLGPLLEVTVCVEPCLYIRSGQRRPSARARQSISVCIEVNRVYAVDGGASVCLAETLDAGMLETRADWSIL